MTTRSSLIVKVDKPFNNHICIVCVSKISLHLITIIKGEVRLIQHCMCIPLEIEWHVVIALSVHLYVCLVEYPYSFDNITMELAMHELDNMLEAGF